jgi:hypothetical protein
MMELTESDKKRLARSGSLTVVLWLALIIAFGFLPMPARNKTVREFTSVKLTLNAEAPKSATAVETVELAAPGASGAEGSAPAGKSPVRKAAKSAPKTATAAKAGGGRTGVAPSAGLGIPNFSSPVTSSNESSGAPEYLDFSSAAQTANPRSASVPPGGTVTEFEGAAAAVVRSGTASSSSSVRQQSTGIVSEGTAQALTRIAGTAGTLSSSSGNTRSGGAGSSESSGTTGAAGSGSGSSASTAAAQSSSLSGISFAGAARKLLYPAEPAIVLPDRLARLVDSDRAVTVQFTVLPDGTVPGTLVIFTPSAVLPAEIRDYLRSEFARWRFESGTEDGHARFQYSIRMQ